MNRHDYVIVESTREGEWNVFCDTCSSMEQDYVHPCRLETPSYYKVPPGTVYSNITSVQL